MLDLFIKISFFSTLIAFVIAWGIWEYNINKSFFSKRIARYEVFFKRIGIVSGILCGILLSIYYFSK